MPIKKFLSKIREYVYSYFLIQKNTYSIYRRKVGEVLIQAILLLFTTTAVNIGLLYFFKLLWYTYISTPVGQRFITMPTRTLHVISDILRIDSVSLSIKVTIAAFTICLQISSVCQVLCISRYLYLPRSFFGKIVIWGLPLAAVVAMRIQHIYVFENWSTAYAVTFVPTLCVFGACFKFTHELLPEIDDFIRKLSLISNQIINSFQTKNANKETNRKD